MAKIDDIHLKLPDNDVGLITPQSMREAFDILDIDNSMLSSGDRDKLAHLIVNKDINLDITSDNIQVLFNRIAALGLAEPIFPNKNTMSTRDIEVPKQTLKLTVPEMEADNRLITASNAFEIEKALKLWVEQHMMPKLDKDNPTMKMIISPTGTAAQMQVMDGTTGHDVATMSYVKGQNVFSFLLSNPLTGSSTANFLIKQDGHAYIGGKQIAVLTDVQPGPDGPAGPRGHDGAKGTKGDKGDGGTIGATGQKGNDGTGVTIKGSDTEAIIVAKTGTAGDMWLITDAGAKHGHGLVSNGQGAGVANWTDVGAIAGPKGDAGAQGQIGNTGLTGAAGSNGADGSMGPKGNTGPIGPQGPQGIQGPKGGDGNDGVKGDKGDSGQDATITFATKEEIKEGTVDNKAIAPNNLPKPLTGFKNIIINGDMRINQRGFDGASFVNNEYCWDRWKTVGSGSGATIKQIIEAGNFTPGVEHVLASRTTVTPLVLIAPSTGNWTIEIANTERGVQLELGTVATPFEQRPIGLELMLCQRYYQIYPRQTYLYMFQKDGTKKQVSMPRTTTMRIAPTETYDINGDGELDVSYSSAEIFHFRARNADENKSTWLRNICCDAEL